MTIEEKKAIKMLDKFITEHKLFNIKQSDGLEEAIETLLTAYEKEKEKNKSLEQENSFLKMMYRGTDEFKAIENLAKEE